LKLNYIVFLIPGRLLVFAFPVFPKSFFKNFFFSFGAIASKNFRYISSAPLGEIPFHFFLTPVSFEPGCKGNRFFLSSNS